MRVGITVLLFSILALHFAGCAFDPDTPELAEQDQALLDPEYQWCKVTYNTLAGPETYWICCGDVCPEDEVGMTQIDPPSLELDTNPDDTSIDEVIDELGGIICLTGDDPDECAGKAETSDCVTISFDQPTQVSVMLGGASVDLEATSLLLIQQPRCPTATDYDVSLRASHSHDFSEVRAISFIARPNALR